jgi:hypothetical protein
VIYNGLDGPGPFAAVQIPLDRLICLVDELDDGVRDTPSGGIGHIFSQSTRDNVECIFEGTLGDPKVIRAHLSIELTLASSDPFTDAGSDYPAIGLVNLKPIVFLRPHESIDVGIGIAANRFSGVDFSGNDFHFWRVSFPFRARIRWPWSHPESPWRALYLSVGADYFPDVLTGTDFRAKPETSGAAFRSSHVAMTSWVIGVDVIKVITRRWKWT